MHVLSRQRGVSLIEVMVAIIIFSVGVLGIALMQIKGAQFTKQAGTRTVAVLQARALADAMRANPAGVWGVDTAQGIVNQKGDLSHSYYAYDGSSAPSSTDCPSASISCQVAKQDLANWLAQLNAAAAAPTSTGGTGKSASLAKVVATSGTGMLTIATTWNIQSSDAAGGATNESYQFNYQP